MSDVASLTAWFREAEAQEQLNPEDVRLLTGFERAEEAERVGLSGTRLDSLIRALEVREVAHDELVMIVQTIRRILPGFADTGYR